MRQQTGLANYAANRRDANYKLNQIFFRSHHSLLVRCLGDEVTSTHKTGADARFRSRLRLFSV
jgi:hypothetical protein